ncbi:hypothetical protein K438DRAFT_1805221 [Mycena galopus ATCC 62051]|nr:hypothetical protein K438DRAFT_1805221 [Mycena galopus ATCC 62051]
MHRAWCSATSLFHFLSDPGFFLPLSRRYAVSHPDAWTIPVGPRLHKTQYPPAPSGLSSWAAYTICLSPTALLQADLIAAVDAVGLGKVSNPAALPSEVITISIDVGLHRSADTYDLFDPVEDEVRKRTSGACTSRTSSSAGTLGARRCCACATAACASLRRLTTSTSRARGRRYAGAPQRRHTPRAESGRTSCARRALLDRAFRTKTRYG